MRRLASIMSLAAYVAAWFKAGETARAPRGAKAVDACADDSLHGRWQRAQPRVHILCVRRTRESATLQQQAHQLFGKERIAGAALHDQRHGVVPLRAGTGQVEHQQTLGQVMVVVVAGTRNKGAGFSGSWVE